MLAGDVLPGLSAQIMSVWSELKRFRQEMRDLVDSISE